MTILLDLVENADETITVLDERDVFSEEENTCELSHELMKVSTQIFLVAQQYFAPKTRIARMVGGVSERNVGGGEKISHSIPMSFNNFILNIVMYLSKV